MSGVELTAEQVAALDDAICDCLMASRWGRYDGRTVDSHLKDLLNHFRGLDPDQGDA